MRDVKNSMLTASTENFAILTMLNRMCSVVGEQKIMQDGREKSLPDGECIYGVAIDIGRIV